MAAESPGTHKLDASFELAPAPRAMLRFTARPVRQAIQRGSNDSGAPHNRSFNIVALLPKRLRSDQDEGKRQETGHLRTLRVGSKRPKCAGRKQSCLKV